MDVSEEIEDESPCFIVLDSQPSESSDERNSETINDLHLKGLTALQPTSNSMEISTKTSTSEKAVNSSSSESVLPSSESSEAQSRDTTPLVSSQDESSSEKQNVLKEHALYITRSERADKITPKSTFRTSTPLLRSDEPLSKEYVVKETSSSDDFVSSSVDLVVQQSSAEETEQRNVNEEEKYPHDETQSKKWPDEGMFPSDEEIIEPHRKPDEHETTTTVAFQCLQSSGEAKETSSSGNDLNSTSSELLMPDSPLIEQLGEVEQEKRKKKTEFEEQKTCHERHKKGQEGHKEHMMFGDEQSMSSRITDQHRNKDRTDTGSTRNLPQWQQQIMSGLEKTSPVMNIGTLSRTISDISASSSQGMSESSLHQWQSPDNASDDMFETDPASENLQGSSILQQPLYKVLSLPQLSQDIFHHRIKAPAHNSTTENLQRSHRDDERTLRPTLSHKHKPDVELSPPDDVVLSSQDDVFCLHMSQSQSSAVSSQARSQPEKQTLLDREGNKDMMSKVTWQPVDVLSATILPQTPIGHPSTTSHHQDIGNSTDTGQTMRSSETSGEERTTQNISDQRPSSKRVLGARANNSKINDSTESIESGLVGFHFSPPVMLLKPVTRTTPSCLDTNLETVQDLSQEIVNAAEFCPTTSETETTNPVPTLSLSVPCDDNTDEDCQELEFKLQKDVLVPNVDTIATLSKHSTRSVFTNVRERFRPAIPNPPDDELDLFEFRDEDYTLPLRKRKRLQKSDVTMRQEEGSDPKKKKSRIGDTEKCGINGDKEDQLGGSDASKLDESSRIEETAQQSNNKHFWRIVKTRIITTTTTLIETETEVIYTDQDNTVITKETKHEFGNPTYETTANENETRERVLQIPAQITFNDVRGTEEARTSTTTVEQSVKRKSSPSRLNNDCANDSLNVAQSTREKNVAETCVNERNYSPQITTSPPLFPGSSNSTVSTSSNSIRNNFAGKISSTEGNLISPPEKQTTDDAPSFIPKEKRKRSLSMDRKQRVSLRCSNFPRGILREGARVLALWYDKHYYPGHVVSKCTNDSKYRIEFDDGDQSDIREQCVIVAEYLPRDQPVMYCEETGGEYFDGVIKGFYQNGDKRGYKVAGVDKRLVRCPCSNVILSAEQAAIFLSLRDSNLTKQITSSESLDDSPPLNDSESCQNTVTKVPRRSCERGTKKSRSSYKEIPSVSGPLTDKDTNMKRKAQKQDNGRGEGKVAERKDNSTVMKNNLAKANPIPTRRSPRKLASRMDVVNNDENLILPANKELFRGYGFLFTGSDVSRGPRDENSPEEEEQVFIRDQVSLQIRTGGGEVLTQFPEDNQTDSCFLLTNVCQTTAKYFYALVLGVPCLSHVWVRDCCIENRLVSFKSYLLPAGRDLITERLIEEQNYRNALRGLKVHLVGDDEFKKQWNEVLNAAGCEMIKKLPANCLKKLQDENDLECDVIVVNGHMSHSTIQKARLLSIPTVTIHWLKQCILSGRRVDFNAQESFIYRVDKK